MAMQIGMGFGKFLARVLFQELGVSVPSSVFHVLFITRSLHAKKMKSRVRDSLLEVIDKIRLLGISYLEVNALDALGAILTPRFRLGYLKRPRVHGLLRHP